MLEYQRRKENIIAAHARLQGDVLILMMAAASGYEDADGEEALERLAVDARHVVEAAIVLQRTVLGGGDG